MIGKALAAFFSSEWFRAVVTPVVVEIFLRLFHNDRLTKEFKADSTKYFDSYREAKTDEERSNAVSNISKLISRS